MIEVRRCEPTRRANARPMTGSAKQSIQPRKIGDDDAGNWFGKNEEQAR
jgi:hypothetical protein